MDQIITMANGVSIALAMTEKYGTIYIKGTPTLTTNWAITATGTPERAQSFSFKYEASPTLAGNHVTILGTQMPDIYISKLQDIHAYYDGSAWKVVFKPSMDQSDIIATGNIINANVTLAKLEPLTSAQVIVGNSSNRPTAVAISGDVTISNAGAVTIGAKKIDTTNLKDAANIAPSQILASTGGRLLGTNGSTKLAEEEDITLTEAEVVHGITPGTSAAGKAVVLDGSSKISALDITALKINGTSVTASAADINQIAGLTPGTAVINKALVLGAAKDVDILNVIALYLDAVLVTSTAAELNVLDGITPVVADLNLLAGLNAAGITNADLLALEYFADNISMSATALKLKQGVQNNIRTFNANDTILTTDNIIVAQVPAGSNLTLTLPTRASCPTKIITIIVDTNSNPHDIVLAAGGADGISYGAAVAVTATITTPAINSIITVVDNGTNWSVGK